MYASTSSSSKENLLKTIRFEKPDYIPMTFHINDACWNFYDQSALQDLMVAHPFLFPGYEKQSAPIVPEYDDVAQADHPYTDDFGCVWKTTEDGIVGTVHDPILGNWADYANFVMPDPEKSTGLRPIDWSVFDAEIAQLKAAGEMTYGDLRHGHTFQQMYDLRGYTNVLMDMVTGDPRFVELLDRLSQFNLAQINHFIKADVDMIRIPEDLGMQTGPMLSPDQFKKYIKPAYQAMMKNVREAGKIIHMHSDGNITHLVDDIIDGGVDIVNLQDVVNGVDWIGQKFRGKTCVDLDIDRQTITPFGTPEEIDRHVRHCVETVGCKEGGLMVIYGLYPRVPLENVAALMDAMERYAGYFVS